MEKKFKRVLALVMVVTTLICTASATVISPRWSYISHVGASITISDTLGIATVSALGAAAHKEVDKVTISASLQQMKDGYWVTLKSWLGTSSTYNADLSPQKWPVAHGYSYRVVATLKAYRGSELLETGVYTNLYGYFK